MSICWKGSREAAFARAHAFSRFMGRDYAAKRNFDLGKGCHAHVSCLSPYVARRLITEWELYDIARTNHSANDCEKFCQEILWRTYWKGWLAQRPQVWSDFLADAKALEGELTSSQENLYRLALQGDTDIECFNDWVAELCTTGYLHNHARMWFASIWIFQLGLPWQLGAQFFYRNLLDADAASNTLSWRWVAGLQTKGKHYVARPENITKFTNGRYYPNNFTQGHHPCTETRSYEPRLFERKGTGVPKLESRTLLIIYDEDLLGDQADLRNMNVVACWGLTPALTSYPRSEVVSNFQRDSLDSSLDRLNAALGVGGQVVHEFSREILDQLSNDSLEQIVFFEPQVGPWQGVIDQLSTLLPQEVPVVRLIRDWDADLFPLAQAGFFRFINAALKRIDSSFEKYVGHSCWK